MRATRSRTGFASASALALLLPLVPAVAQQGGPSAGAAVAGDEAAIVEDADAATIAQLSDQDIADAIEDRWLSDGILDLDRIDVTVDDGIAQIDGIAYSLLEKQRAMRIAEAVRGVRAVSNQLDVEPPAGVEDAEIRSQIETGLMFDPALGDGKVSVSVDEGIAILSGTVSSWPERHSAERVAEGVRGVVAVDNRIEVAKPEERVDAEIRADVEERLRWDVRLSTVPLAVSVEDGIVHLSGTVASAAQKRWARWKSWVTGVQGVVVEGVTVAPWRDDDDWRKKREPQVDDAAIQDAIADALLYDPRVSTFNVTADVADGWVTLRGQVPALSSKQAAERLARHTVGVTGVINRIRVRPDADGVDDSEIATRVLNALAANPYTDADAITVRVRDGRVTLTGVVETRSEKREAARVAAGVPAVTDVRNALELINDLRVAD